MNQQSNRPTVTCRQVGPNLYLIKESDYRESCNCYLVVGSERCLLIDTGVGLANFSETIKPIIGKKELIVVLTHFHFDHCGGAGQFPLVYAKTIDVNQKDLGLAYLRKEDFSSEDLFKKASKHFDNFHICFSHLENEEIINLGNIQLKVIYTPGHDSSSISLFEPQSKILFSGDLIYPGKLYYNLPDSNIEKYIESLKNLKELTPKIICGGHNQPILELATLFIEAKIEELASAKLSSEKYKLGKATENLINVEADQQIMDFRHEIVSLLSKEAKLPQNEVDAMLAVPPDNKLGDYAFPCFKLGKNAKEIAEQLKAKIKLPKYLSKIEVAGPYLNFYLHPASLAQDTLVKIYTERKKYGEQVLGKGKTIVIDFSAPNIAKPFGIGHLRSTVIGNSLYKVYQALGYKVVGVNHLGDWGTQFGKLIVAFKKWGEAKKLEEDPIHYLLQIYVKFHEEAEKNPQLEEEAREEFKKLELGDKSNLKLWETFKALSLEEFKRIYKILDIEFDSYHGEAFYNDKMEAAIKAIQKKIPTEISEGALIVNLEKYKLPPMLLRKSNESSTYHTRDIAAALYRLKEYDPEKILYVVGSEQKLNFQQLFKVLELYGADKNKFIHVDFGLFRFPEGKMSTRQGKVIFLEEVLNKAIALAEKIIEEKNPTLKDKKEIALIIGVGAIIFGDLSNDRIRDIDFDWDKMLSFEGETGPYLQYTHARAGSILRKAESQYAQVVTEKIDFTCYTLPEEVNLIKKMYDFPEIIGKAAQNNKPHILADHLIELAQAFNEFYHQCPVISEDEKLMQARLLLVFGLKQVLENGLRLLGIKAPEEM